MLTRRCGCAGGPSTFFSLPPLTLQPDPQAIANRGGPANFGSWSRIWRHGRSARQSIANFSSRRHCATGDPDPLAVHEWCAGLSVVDASDNAVIPTGNACLPTMMVVHELHSFLQRMKHRDDARCGDARALSSSNRRSVISEPGREKSTKLSFSFASVLQPACRHMRAYS
jgi:hypothetical protein